jgi:2'-5' RNA ligase
MVDRRHYLVAYLAPELCGALDAASGPRPAKTIRQPIEAARRHLTVLNLAIVDMPEALLVAALRLAMSASPPTAFRVVLDAVVMRSDRALIVASEPVAGFRRCQRDLLAGLRRYTLDLPPRHAAVKPHVTLGYDCVATDEARGIDGVSWQVDALTLIASHHGKGRHETIDHWRLRPSG